MKDMDDQERTALTEVLETDHALAMQCVDEYEDALRAGHLGLARRRISEAVTFERLAAAASSDRRTRAVLYRSAASLAYLAGRPKEALHLTELGFIEAPPDIAQELVELIRNPPEPVAWTRMPK